MQRRTRTKGSMAQAALDLAAASPLSDITVTALAERAGITRETFYRYAASVADAVADALGAELEALQAQNPEIPAVSTTGESVFLQPTRALVAHVSHRAAVYRHALQPRLHPRLRELLMENLSRGLAAHLDAHPEIAPPIGAARPGPFDRAGMVAYAAAGTIGVLEEWLALTDPADPDRLTQVILAAAPEWWQGRV
ncbi:hypothetical protein [Paractinoplanes lichenicola]|uniref:HTH tetR-type domain-containing protein n=1 Tax=Paractinoplanes lichenicola TaxID=2802976 RepID=A0ABS1VHD7_9ACTN|nr:hypothetical protein [Actinoplanes lichenicola]MBL7253167.1 hypothetical protein [Actinoplanes lichenicola]